MVLAAIDIRYAAALPTSETVSSTAQSWLSASERSVWARLRSNSRKRTWLAGRILAKKLLLSRHSLLADCDPQQISVVSSNATARGVPPIVLADRVAVRCALSIAHTELGAIVAFTENCSVRVGADLVPTGLKLRQGFLKTWFSPREVADILQSRQSIPAAALWSVKEAVYKACNQGDPFVPRRIEVSFGSEGTNSIRYHAAALGSQLALRIWKIGGHHAVLAVCAAGKAVDSRPGEPWIQRSVA